MPDVILTGFADEGSESKRAEEQLAVFRGLGLSYYSLRFIDVGKGVKNVMQLTAGEVQSLRRLHQAFEMEVSSIGSPIGKVKLRKGDDGTTNVYVPAGQYLRRTVDKAIRLAQEFETRLIRGFSFYPPRGDDPWEYVDEAAERIGEIVDRCAQAGLFYGLEVEANLVGRSGDLQMALFEKVRHPHLMLIFDGANIVCQGCSAEQTYEQYLAMKPALGWMHIKDYRHTPGVQWQGYVDEEMLRHFVPADQGDVGHERILRDFKGLLPGLARKLKRRGVPGIFLDLEPHLKGGGQFGGFSGPDGMGVALRALTRLLDYVGISYQLTGYQDLRR